VVFDANTRLCVERGTGPDPYGDDIDTRHTVAVGVPASVRSMLTRVSDPSDGRIYTVVSYRIRVPTTLDVRVGDRLVAPGGSVYVVDQVANDEPSWQTGFGTRIEARDG
jgi:hypothetical protein